MKDDISVIEMVNRRNTQSFNDKLKEMSQQIFDQQVKIDVLHTAISSMSERMNLLETMVLHFKVKMTGTGASVI
jgi:hypothetical protein